MTSPFRYKVAACVMYKNEADFITEWLDYHILIGVEHFYVYNNLSTDNHKDVLKPYVDRNLITYHDYDVDISKICDFTFWRNDQYPYTHCINNYKHESEWCAFIDMDEFIHIRNNSSIGAMMDKYRGHGGLAINWLMFGPSGHYFEPGGSVIQNYTLRKPCRTKTFVKSVINPRLCNMWGCPHLPHMKTPIVFSDFTPCTISHSNKYIHTECSIYHYYSKSKWYYIYRKMARAINIEKLRTDIVNTHDRSDKTFGNLYYSDAVRWEICNMLVENLIEDTSLLEKARSLGMKFKPVVSPQYLNRNYLSIPAVKAYYDNNIRSFRGQSMAVLFHRHFIFDSSLTSDGRTEIDPRYLLNSNEKDDAFFIAKYNNPAFLNYLTSLQKDNIDIEPVSFSVQVARKFYYDFEYWLPDGFNMKTYIQLNPELNSMSEYDVITHWILHGQYEERSWYKESFDWKYYVTTYPDLAHMNEQEALQHWRMFGQYEGRIPYKDGFDWKYYVTTYPDLAHMDEKEAYQHWIFHGQRERRQCHA